MWLDVLEKPLERREAFVGALLVPAARSSWRQRWWGWVGSAQTGRCEVLLVTAPQHSWVQQAGLCLQEFSAKMFLSCPARVPQLSQVD